MRLSPRVLKTAYSGGKAAIDGILTGGNTDLHDGWRAGSDALAAPPLPAGLKRAILLSDGGANQGITDAAEIAKQCAELAARNISTSTYGLGKAEFPHRPEVGGDDAGAGTPA